MRLEAVIFGVSFAIIAGPMFWPRGLVVEREEKRLNGSLTTYRRVSGLEALKHWRKGELLPGDRS
jgi:hypothetical protein